MKYKLIILFFLTSVFGYAQINTIEVDYITTVGSEGIISEGEIDAVFLFKKNVITFNRKNFPSINYKILDYYTIGSIQVYECESEHDNNKYDIIFSTDIGKNTIRMVGGVYGGNDHIFNITKMK